MKNFGLFTFMSLLLLVSIAQAGLLPVSSYYSGHGGFSYDLGPDGILDLHLEFEVYTDFEAEIMIDMTGHTRDTDYVYAYQVFVEESSTAALTYFALSGINSTTIASVDDIAQAESLTAPNFTVFDSGGVAPSPDGYFNASKTEAIWDFEDGGIIPGQQSWFLFLYSDYDWVAAEQSSDFHSIPIPGIPEPATLSLLALGGLLLRKRK